MQRIIYFISNFQRCNVCAHIFDSCHIECFEIFHFTKKNIWKSCFFLNLNWPLFLLLGGCTKSAHYMKNTNLPVWLNLYPVHTYHKTCSNRVLLNVSCSKPFSLKINQVLIFRNIRKPCWNKITYRCCFTLVLIKHTCNGGRGKHSTSGR